jgi:hypothetical protein
VPSSSIPRLIWSSQRLWPARLRAAVEVDMGELRGDGTDAEPTL